MTIAVTGGSGVVGGAVVRMLLAQGREVRALCRSADSASSLETMGALPVRGDLLDADSLHRLVDGCETVFNSAGVNELCVRDPSHMENVNIEAISTILEACRGAGVRRLVHTSSAVTIGEAKGTVGSEGSPHRGYFLSQYERTKFLGEKRLFAEAGALEVVAVNPSSVQGPGRSTGTGKLILDVVNGRLRYLVDSVISLVDIDDCARGHILAAERGEPGNRYILSGATLGVREAIGLAASASSREIRLRFLPGGLVSGAISLVEPLSKVFGRHLPICKEMVRVMRFGHTYDGSRAVSELGLEYRSVVDTVGRLVDWFGSEGLLAPG